MGKEGMHSHPKKYRGLAPGFHT